MRSAWNAWRETRRKERLVRREAAIVWRSSGPARAVLWLAATAFALIAGLGLADPDPQDVMPLWLAAACFATALVLIVSVERPRLVMSSTQLAGRNVIRSWVVDLTDIDEFEMGPWRLRFRSSATGRWYGTDVARETPAAAALGYRHASRIGQTVMQRKIG